MERKITDEKFFRMHYTCFTWPCGWCRSSSPSRDKNFRKKENRIGFSAGKDLELKNFAEPSAERKKMKFRRYHTQRDDTHRGHWPSLPSPSRTTHVLASRSRSVLRHQLSVWFMKSEGSSASENVNELSQASAGSAASPLLSLSISQLTVRCYGNNLI